MWQDELGRLFAGSDSLLVYDGQTWTSHPKPSDYPLISLARGRDGTLWSSTVANLGYFTENSFGTFEYHSLLRALPPETAHQLGTVWGSAPLGSATYFITKDQLLRWDGKAFQISPFPTSRRLAPVRLGEEFWFHHQETGLYQLTESGPVLKTPASGLPGRLLMGLFRGPAGLVAVSNEGLTRVGEPAPYSPAQLNAYLTQNRVSAFAELPDGNLVIGTVFGGLVLASQTGEVLRIWADSSSGLPGREIIGLLGDGAGNILGATATDFFQLHATGETTVFNHLNGLKGEVVNDLGIWNSRLFAAANEHAHRLDSTAPGAAHFEPLAGSVGPYFHLLPCADGLLLSKFGGVDWFDGTTTRQVYPLQANTAYFVQAARNSSRMFYVAEVAGLARLVRNDDGSFTGTRFLDLPDNCASLHEDAAGRLWIGTVAKGVFCYDPASGQLAPVHDPATGRPFAGLARIAGNDSRLLFFLKDRVLLADAQGRGVRELGGLPAVNPTVIRAVPGTDDLLVAYQQPADKRGPLRGVAVLSVAADGTARWRELDLNSLASIGSVRAGTFSEENGRRILWLGGAQGVLRFDYDRIPTLLAPPPPIIRVPDAPTNAGDGPISHPYQNHRVQFRVFTADYIRGRSLLFQTRLGNGDSEWSAASSRRAFEYTNLTDGNYRFEVRAVNAAGQSSAPASFTFRILPPWYRSGWAYAGYTAALGLGVFGFIRIRERRIRARNLELEGLVEVRTAELVKASAAKDEFLAGISHEIRNPMNGVIGIAENFRTEALDAESRRKFGLLRQCASHLSSLLEDILDFSKVQAGAIELDPKPFDLPELVESVAGITRTDSEKYGIPVSIAVSPVLPPRLVGDARRIRQILINFVSNALKFSGRGEVTVTVYGKLLDSGQAEVIFAVSDEGPGISAEEQARLFTRFERGAAAQKGRVPGTGLGLALCKGLAEKMGGRLWLESELGHGSCFYFSAPFPVAAAAVPAVTPAASTTVAAARTALVVDDQEYNRIVLGDLLQSLGFAVHQAQAGEAAIEVARRQDFDAIFLDFNLPGISGVDVARSIRALPNASAHALILATTAFTTPEKRSQCLDAGMDAFLGKPVTKERLTTALARILSKAPTTPVPASPAKTPATPANPFGNLGLLARKKGVSLAIEAALYLAELETELTALDTAIARGDSVAAGKAAHMLCGRCAFIYERELEQTQRGIESAVHAAQWDEARRLRGVFDQQLAGLRVRLAAASGPAAPPA